MLLKRRNCEKAVCNSRINTEIQIQNYERNTHTTKALLFFTHAHCDIEFVSPRTAVAPIAELNSAASVVVFF